MKTLKVLEIDPVVEQVARNYFKLPEDKRLAVSIGDGRELMEQEQSNYDLILMDAFLSKTIPFHLATVEFFQLVSAKLNDRGVVLMNVFGSLLGQHSGVLNKVLASLKIVFENLYMIPDMPDQPERLQSVIVVGCKSSEVNEETVITRAKKHGNLVGGYLTDINLVIGKLQIVDYMTKTDILRDKDKPESGMLNLY
nr:fused MFS/spermidine synthase [Desulforamulus aquiferis]